MQGFNVAQQNKEQGQSSRLLIAFVLSMAIHAALAWFLTTQRVQPVVPEKQEQQIMDVVLLDESQPSLHQQPSNAQTVSNKNSKGHQQDAQDNMTRASRSPLVNQRQKRIKEAQPLLPKQAKKHVLPKQQTKENTRILTRADADALALLNAEQQAPTTKKNVLAPAPPYIPMSELLSLGSAVSEISRDVQREKRMKQMMSQEDDIGINTTEAKYAPYAQGLVRALEEQWRPAHDDLKSLQPHERQVVMRVTIEHNGRLGNIHILQSSPSAQLNDSAVSAVHGSAPFKSLPSSWGLERAHFYFVFEVVDDQFVFRTL